MTQAKNTIENQSMLSCINSKKCQDLTPQEIDHLNDLLRSNYHKTAITKPCPSSPMVKFLNWLKENPQFKTHIKRVIDLGAGHCRDRVTCVKEFGKYLPYDPHPKFRVKRKFDDTIKDSNTLLICNYVLNVIIPEDREIIINLLKKQLEIGNIILLGVRADRRNIQDYWGKYEDGYITGRAITRNSTFQHFYSNLEVKKIFEEHATITPLLRANDNKRENGMFVLIPKRLSPLLNNLTKFMEGK